MGAGTLGNVFGKPLPAPCSHFILPGPFPASGQWHKALIVSCLLVFKGSFVAGPG